jgi:hypothetical protein
VSKRIPKTWYVAISIPNHEKTGYYSRRSTSFPSESAAKQFAATEVAKGIEVSAGTLNPVLPRRIIGPSDIAKWLSEGTSKGPLT